MPVAAWIVSECLINWTERWGSSQAEAVGLNIREAVLSNTENEPLNFQCYWLSTCIAVGGIMRVTRPYLKPATLHHSCISVMQDEGVRELFTVLITISFWMPMKRP